MLVYAGIDEAGYGPMLGPLCVAAATFVLDAHDPAEGAPNLWGSLRSAVCRSRRDKKQRIAIDDSKKLKGARDAIGVHPLRHLERGVLAVLAAHGDVPAHDGALLDRLGARVPPQPWYTGRVELPVGQTRGEIRVSAGRLRRAMERAGMRAGAIDCELVDAGDFNRRCHRTGNKAAVNIECVMQLVDRVRRAWGGAHPRVVVDRQSGRIHYREELQLAFPDASIQVIHESSGLSRYRLAFPDTGPLTIGFTQEAERGHLPVALASMTAKYTRELLMIRMNRFFGEQIPELAPTAGYFVDGRRYLRDIQPAIERLGIERGELVRAV